MRSRRIRALNQRFDEVEGLLLLGCSRSCSVASFALLLQFLLHSARVSDVETIGVRTFMFRLGGLASAVN